MLWRIDGRDRMIVQSPRPADPSLEDRMDAVRAVLDNHPATAEILNGGGVGMLPHAEWGHSRSGSYFCFHQQRIEWPRLKERHSDLFEAANAYERPYEGSGNTFTWCGRESLAELERPERMRAIKEEHVRRLGAAREDPAGLTLSEVYRRRETLDDSSAGDAWLICHQ